MTLGDPLTSRSLLVPHVHVTWWLIHVMDLRSLKHKISEFHSIPFFPPLFFVYVLCHEEPRGFCPRRAEGTYSQPCHPQAQSWSQGRSTSLSTSAWMFPAAFGINPWLPPPQRGHRRSCKSKRKKLDSFFMSSYPLF